MNLEASKFIPHTIFELDMDTDGYLNYRGTVSVCNITLQVFKSSSLFVSTDKYIFFFFLELYNYSDNVLHLDSVSTILFYYTSTEHKVMHLL